MRETFELPSRYSDCKKGFSDLLVIPQNAVELELCKEYVENISANLEQSNNMRFFGDIGTGKSTLAWALAYEVRTRGYRVKWAKWHDIQELSMSEAERHSWFEYLNREEDEDLTEGDAIPYLVRQLWDADFLVVDDGLEPFHSCAFHEALKVLVRTRHRPGKATVFVDTLPPIVSDPGLRAWLDSMSWSNYREVKFSGSDYRAEHAEKDKWWGDD